MEHSWLWWGCWTGSYYYITEKQRNWERGRGREREREEQTLYKNTFERKMCLWSFVISFSNRHLIDLDETLTLDKILSRQWTEKKHIFEGVAIPRIEPSSFFSLFRSILMLFFQQWWNGIISMFWCMLRWCKSSTRNRCRGSLVKWST